MIQGSLQYLVHWRGYGPEERTWVPARDVQAGVLIRRFHLLFPTKPGPLSKGPVAPHKRGSTVKDLPGTTSVDTPRINQSTPEARPLRLTPAPTNQGGRLRSGRAYRGLVSRS
ncbi:hypothetical protein [Salmonella sp. S103_04178]|uniref:hypothetical protein n=1 Tax=Salmonella sp. S103_04178 TaxID=2665595 RepID=UPI00397771E8